MNYLRGTPPRTLYKRALIGNSQLAMPESNLNIYILSFKCKVLNVAAHYIPEAARETLFLGDSAFPQKRQSPPTFRHPRPRGGDHGGRLPAGGMHVFRPWAKYQFRPWAKYQRGRGRDNDGDRRGNNRAADYPTPRHNLCPGDDAHDGSAARAVAYIELGKPDGKSIFGVGIAPNINMASMVARMQ